MTVRSITSKEMQSSDKSGHVRLMRILTLLSLSLITLTAVPAVAAPPAFAPVRSILAEQCFACHNATTTEGGFNLERFDSLDSTKRDRVTWKRVFDVVEAGQMPLTDSGYQLTAAERATLLNFVIALQAQPDPVLQAVDPGKPVLRRLTRLEYSNTVRDLFGLEYDIFMFSERLPVADKQYFLESRDTGLGDALRTSMREYGQKYDVLLPQQGLPGDNRAEYGYANRGDALNFSPLLLEKYLELAHAISHSERLERDSPVMAGLLGRRWQPPAHIAAQGTANPRETVPASPKYAANDNIARHAEGNDTWKAAFVSKLSEAFERGSGGTYDIPASQNNQTIAGRGGLIRVAVGGGTLTINPNVDLWLAAFATAQETSGEHLLTNKVNGEKTFELTFKVEGGGDLAGVEHLGVCVLARKNQHGPVRLTAILADGHELSRQAEIAPDKGNVFFTFVSPPGTVIRRLRVDGSQFSGDYVLLDDIGFILRGVEESRELPATGPRLSESSDAPRPDSQSQATTDTRSFSRTIASLPIDERILQFLRRAYRRDVSEAEAAPTVAIVSHAIDAGVSEPDAVRLAVQSVLASPEFLFLSEPFDPAAGSVRPLNDFELASRLSYFLWSSMPDDELLRLASQGELSKTETLRQQVGRMLRDRRKSRELSESFAVQWLKLDQLYSAKPDRHLFKDFYSGPQGKATLHGAMLTEPLLLFETVLVENRSVVDLCDADFTWLNSQLADLYGLQEAFQLATATTMDKPSARDWYRVALPDRTRGGVMTMAGPLMLTSLPFRTSPIKRGAWLLETVFNRPPAEPKVAFVLEESKPEDGNDLAEQSVRQRFEKHRSDPNCYSCHSRIDPPGFSLESFDAIGKLRTHDGTQPVDASGVWNETPFSGPAEFKAALRRHEQEIVRGFVEHLLSYALGRPVEHFDMPAVTMIVDDAATEDHRIRRMIEGVVLSYPFRMTRNPRVP
jgi:mono/diheme cytochrome c family protein